MGGHVVLLLGMNNMKIKIFSGHYRQGYESSVWIQTKYKSIGFRIGNWFRFDYKDVHNSSKRFYLGPFCLEYNNYKG